MKFGGFIITFNRPEVLIQTLTKVFKQSFPPEIVWIIDNSEDLNTLKCIASLNDSRVKYHRMGFNAGPAGAAKIGLELCEKEGLDWIYWGDDNDPPYFDNTFENLLGIRESNPFCGIIGSVGHFFDRKKGIIKRIQSRLLEKKEIVEVDVVAGGMSMLISSDVVRSGVFPDPELFFGFEELDFCLKATRKGFVILVRSDEFLRLRRFHNRINFDRPIYQKKNNPSREYYSLRNLLFISDGLTLKSMKRNLIRKWLAKMLIGFRFGFIYGFKNFKMISLAFMHYYKGIKGKSIPL